MRSLKYVVLGVTPMLAAAGFAQGLSVGMKDQSFMQAQAGDTGGGQMGQGGSDRMSQQGNPKSDPMPSDKSAAHAQGASAKKDPAHGSPSHQVRKGRKQQPKDNGG